MKTTDEITGSKSLEEVWRLKEKASEATKNLSFDQLQKHYRQVVEKAAKLLGVKIVETENGRFKFER
jgi:hypothetical protein